MSIDLPLLRLTRHETSGETFGAFEHHSGVAGSAGEARLGSATVGESTPTIEWCLS